MFVLTGKLFCSYEKTTNLKGHALPSKNYCKLLKLQTQKEKGEQKRERKKGSKRKKISQNKGKI